VGELGERRVVVLLLHQAHLLARQVDPAHREEDVRHERHRLQIRRLVHTLERLLRVALVAVDERGDQHQLRLGGRARAGEPLLELHQRHVLGVAPTRLV
jgi:hypothetical protein